MGYTSYKQRKALGRRYSTDPALEIEKERLRGMYALAPGREALAYSKERDAESRRLQEEALDAGELSGMIGTGSNLLSTAAMMRALTMEKGTPFFGGLFGGSVAPPAAGVGARAVPAGLTTGAVEAAVVPSGTTAAPGALATYGPPAAAVAGIEIGGQLLKPLIPKIAEELPGGEKEWEAGRKIATRAGQGAVIGSVVPGVGTAIGAVVGGIVGIGETLLGGTWLCTEIDKFVGINKADKKMIKELRRYSLENHKDCYETYLIEGKKLVTAINEREKPEFYIELKKELVDKVVDKINIDDLEGAFIAYVDVTNSLMSQYTPEIEPLVKEVL